MHRHLRLIGLAGLLLASTAAAAAQAPSGTLAGLADAAGKPLAGVSVTVVRAGTMTAAGTTTTAADGKYQVTGLAQGVYRVEFRRDGFEPVTRTGIVVFTGSVAELNVTMTAIAGTPARQPASDFRAQLAPGEVAVRIETPLGAIVLAIDTARAPITAANFLKYVDAGYYDGGRFTRATRPDNYTPVPPDRPMMEIIQGGINPERRGAAFPPIPLERTNVTGLKHVRGTVSMARGAPDSATTEFFILLDDQPSLDFGGKRFDDGQGGAAFGRVIAGLDVVRAIQQQPVKGQSLTPPVPISSARRIQ